MHIFFQNNQYLGYYYFTRSADDPVNIYKYLHLNIYNFPSPETSPRQAGEAAEGGPGSQPGRGGRDGPELQLR